MEKGLTPEASAAAATRATNPEVERRRDVEATCRTRDVGHSEDATAHKSNLNGQDEWKALRMVWPGTRVKTARGAFWA